MDKYTYNIKADKIQKLVRKGDYATAVKIADTVDWEEIHSVRMLTMTASAYEHVRDYKTAIELLEMAYEESTVGKRMLYKLTGLAIADGDAKRAQHYYEMYLQEAPGDNGRYLLRYLLAEMKGEPLDKRIAILETYRKYEFEEEWALRLAELYDEAGFGDACVKLCDEIILWFGVGPCVEEAMKLKEKYVPLSAVQAEHRDNKEYYEQRYREVVEESRSREVAEPDAEEPAPAEEAEKTPEGEAPAGEPAPAKPAKPARIQSDEPAWTQRFLFVEGTLQQEVIRGALKQLSVYHGKKNEPMNRLTSIAGRRLNTVGVEEMLRKTEGKDILVGDASELTDELLTELLKAARDNENGPAVVFADSANQLAYLGERLGILYNKLPEEELPDIQVSAPDEDVVIHLEDLEEETRVYDPMKAPTRVVGDLPGYETLLFAGEGSTTVVPTRAVREAEEKAEEAEGVNVSETEETVEEIEARWLEATRSAEETAEAVTEAAEEVQTEAQEAVEEVREEAEEAAEAVTEAAEEVQTEAQEAVEEVREEAEEEVQTEAQEAGEEVREKAEEAAEAVTEAVEEVQTEAQEAVEEVREEAEEAAEAVTEAVEEAQTEAEEIAEEARGEVEEAAEAVTEAAEEVQTEAQEAAEEVREEAEEAAEEAAAEADAFVLRVAEGPEPVRENDSAYAERSPAEEEEDGLVELGRRRAEELLKGLELPAYGAAAAAAADRETSAEPEMDLPEIAATETESVEAELKETKTKTKEKTPKAGKEARKAAKKAEAEAEEAEETPASAVSSAEKAFVTWAAEYIREIDCVTDEEGMLAILEAARARAAKGVELTRGEAEQLIEDAADRAEKKGGLFTRRYDKNGCLILRAKHIR